LSQGEWNADVFFFSTSNGRNLAGGQMIDRGGGRKRPRRRVFRATLV